MIREDSFSDDEDEDEETEKILDLMIVMIFIKSLDKTKIIIWQKQKIYYHECVMRSWHTKKVIHLYSF